MKDQNNYHPKDKSSAVILAVLFGFFGWIYTYKDDSWKFWLNLILTVLSFGLWGFVAWIWAIIDQGTKQHKYYQDYYL